jgi:hypothetical protein
MRPAITMGSFAMNVLAWNNYIEDSLCRSQNHAPAACCVWKALNQRVSAGGQEPMTVCPGQRRPDSIEVKTYLQMSDFGYGQVAKP